MADALLIAIPATIYAVAALVTAFSVYKKLKPIHQAVTAVLSEVATMNGKSVGELLDLNEGRRIDADVPAALQTASEKHYVEAVKEDERKK